MFIPLLLVLVGWILYLAAARGPRTALWVGWMTVLILAPAWIVKGFGSLQMDLRTGAAITVLAGFLIFQKEPLRLRWLWLDTLFLLLVATQAVSGFSAGEIRPLTIPEIVRWWLPAYIMGRLFFQSPGDLNRILPVVAKLMLFLSIYAITEALLRVNVVNALLGKHYAILDAGEGYRWGIKRAQGPLDHPIFFGMMMVMMFPWALEAGRRAKHGDGPRWWWALPALAFGAVFCTASRGPIIATVLTVYVTYFFRRPKLRLAMAAVFVGGAVGVYAGQQALVDALARAAGESKEQTRTIVIEGDEYEYTGTRHRLLLYRVYWKAIREAGLFGYGGLMRGVPIEKHLVHRFSSIDNHYLLFLLQRGYAGIACFVAVTVCALFYLGVAAWNPRLSQAGFAAALFGALASVAVLLQTVWFAPDFAVVWIFCAGMAGSLRSLPPETTAESTDKEAPSEPPPGTGRELPRRIVPGWAPTREPKKEPPDEIT
jgi:hypothetical protein